MVVPSYTFSRVTWDKKKMSVSGVSLRDNRGKKIPPNKIFEERANIMKEHIN